MFSGFPFVDQYVVFVLVLTRISGLVMTAPIFGSRHVPMRVRAFLAVGMALIITPLHTENAPPVPSSVVQFMVILGRELMLGLALGLAVMILFTALQLTGQILGQMSGMSLADVFDPGFGQSVPMFTQLLDAVTLSVFIVIGGHRQVMQALLDTFRWRPPGSDDFPPDLVASLVHVLHESFVVGIRAAAPVMVALLLSIVVLGLISRTLPQLNILAVGFSLNSMVMVLTLALSLGGIAWLVQEQAYEVIDTMRGALSGAQP